MLKGMVDFDGCSFTRSTLWRGRRIYIYICIYIYIYPPTSSERRACETTAVKLIPAFQNTSPSNKATAQAAQDDPCLQQPRLDAAQSDQLFFFRSHSSIKSRATARPSLRSLPSPWALNLMLPPAQECQIAYLSTGAQSDQLFFFRGHSSIKSREIPVPQAARPWAPSPPLRHSPSSPG